MIYYGYARVSSVSQSDESIEEQLEFLEEEAKKQGCQFEAVSEKKSAKDVEGRDALIGLIAKLENGDIIGFKYNDRYGRDTQEDLTLLKVLNEKNVKVHINGKFVNIDNPTDELTFTVLSAISTYFRKLQRAKSAIGIKKSRDKGNIIFNHGLYGYRIVSENGKRKVEIVEKEAEILRYIYAEYITGKSIKSIAKALNEKGLRTRHDCLFNTEATRRWLVKPIYKGCYSTNGGQSQIRYDEKYLVKSNHYPAIIDANLWNKVNKSYQTIHRAYAKDSQHRWTPYELSSILKCGYCDSVYTHGKWKSYRAAEAHSNYVHKVYKEDNSSGCGQTFFTLRAEVLECLFRMCYYLLFVNIIELSDFFSEKQAEYDKSTEDINEDIKRLQKLLGGIEISLKNNAQAISKYGADDSLHNERLRLSKEEQDLKNALDKKEEALRFGKGDLESLFENFHENKLLQFVHAESPKRRKIYLDTLESAYVVDGQIKIKFKNTKEYMIPLSLNRGRRIQRQFEIQVHFDGKHQYDVSLDTEKNDLKYIRKAIDRGLEQREKLFKVAAEQMNEDMINGLKMKIENFVSVESV